MNNPFASFFARNARPNFIGVQEGNPAHPLPHWEITGTPRPVAIPAPVEFFDKAAPSPFPARSVVRQPTNNVVIG